MQCPLKSDRLFSETDTRYKETLFDVNYNCDSKEKLKTMLQHKLN